MKAVHVLRSLLGIVVGIAVGILATFIMHGMRAVVIGSLAAAAIAGLRKVKTAVMAGSLTGAGLGFFFVARGQHFFAALWVPAGPLTVLIHLVLGAMVCGLLGALFSFVTSKLKPLFDEGRGPHF